jgi:hypothetical protein
MKAARSMLSRPLHPQVRHGAWTRTEEEATHGVYPGAAASAVWRRER